MQKDNYMRFNCKITLKTNRGNNELKIPCDYRKYISSLIKEAFKISGDNNFYTNNFERNKIKPYTFSTFFYIKEIKDNYFILKDNFFYFNFSSSDYEYLIRIYNGLLQLKNKFKIFDSDLYVEDFNLRLKPNYTFNDNAKFKTLSPILIRAPENGDYYFVPEDIIFDGKFKYAKKVNKETFLKAIKLNIESILKMGVRSKLLDDEILKKDFEIKSYNLKLSPALHSSNRSNFKLTFPALKGVIEISAIPEIIKFLYDSGIGARRSEGFGMLEVER